ncbi:MAG: zinc ribbon domain-containing protein [Firmicutes bacterium]|nr:zinc ribbon domain-containing protein [Bacillota bacterium]
MYCANCGLELPAEANFCWKCGQPCKEPAETAWETCQIEYETVRDGFLYRGDDLRFVAQASGPRGEYIAGKSRVFRTSPFYNLPSTQEHRDLLDVLVNKLIQEGWERVGEPGEFWWNYTFRRPVRGI